MKKKIENTIDNVQVGFFNLLKNVHFSVRKLAKQKKKNNCCILENKLKELNRVRKWRLENVLLLK